MADRWQKRDIDQEKSPETNSHLCSELAKTKSVVDTNGEEFLQQMFMWTLCIYMQKEK